MPVTGKDRYLARRSRRAAQHHPWPGGERNLERVRLQHEASRRERYGGRRVTDHELKEPFSVPAEAHEQYRTYKSKGATDDRRVAAGKKAGASKEVATMTSGMTSNTATGVRPTNRRVAILADDDSTDTSSLIAWLQTTEWVKGWSRAVMVRRQGLEPRTR